MQDILLLKIARGVGFSLIELIIVIAIIGILAGISYPLYQGHLVRVRRAQATLLLTDTAARMEEYYHEHNSYEGATLALLGAPSGDQFYRLVIASATSKGFRVEAAPSGTQASADKKCGVLAINQLGERSAQGLGGVVECW